MSDPNQPHQPEQPAQPDAAAETGAPNAAPAEPAAPAETPAPPYGAPPASTYPGAPQYPGGPAAPQYPGAAAPYPGAPASAPYPGAAPAAAPYPGPSAGAPYPGPAANPGRTNPISILAIITGFVAPLIGVISGIVALTQIRRTGEKGRGLAITGISVGGALMVLGTLGFILFFAFFAAIEDSYTPYEDPFTDSEEAPPGSEQDVFALAVGDCLLESDAGADEVFSVPVVDCSLPHDYEVYAEVTLTDAAEYPGDDLVSAEAEELCYEPFAPYVGISWEESALNYSYYSPSESSWAEGDRAVTCLVLDPTGEQLTGSVAGTGL